MNMCKLIKEILTCSKFNDNGQGVEWVADRRS
jgi:hypothetical protein